MGYERFRTDTSLRMTMNRDFPSHPIHPRVEHHPVMTISRLTLQNFRNYPQLRLEAAPGFVVLSGENGAGKTNILEAVSLLAPGRGLRRAALKDIAYEDGSGDFAVAAEMGRDDLEFGEAAFDGGDFPGATGILLGRQLVADMDHEGEMAFHGGEERQQRRVVQAEALEVGMEFDAADAVIVESCQFAGHVGELRVHGAEGDHAGDFAQRAGPVIGRDDLFGGGCCRVHEDLVDVAGSQTLLEVVPISAADRLDAIMTFQLLHGLFGNLGVKGVRVHIDAFRGRHGQRPCDNRVGEGAVGAGKKLI